MTKSKPLIRSIGMFIIICALVSVVYFITTGGHTDLRFFIDIYAVAQLFSILTVIILMFYIAKRPRLFLLFFCSLSFLTFLQLPLSAMFWFTYRGELDMLLFATFHTVVFIWGLINLAFCKTSKICSKCTKHESREHGLCFESFTTISRRKGKSSFQGSKGY